MAAFPASGNSFPVPTRWSSKCLPGYSSSRGTRCPCHTPTGTSAALCFWLCSRPHGVFRTPSGSPMERSDTSFAGRKSITGRVPLCRMSRIRRSARSASPSRRLFSLCQRLAPFLHRQSLLASEPSINLIQTPFLGVYSAAGHNQTPARIGSHSTRMNLTRIQGRVNLLLRRFRDLYFNRHMEFITDPVYRSGSRSSCTLPVWSAIQAAAEEWAFDLDPSAG